MTNEEIKGKRSLNDSFEKSNNNDSSFVEAEQPSRKEPKDKSVKNNTAKAHCQSKNSSNFNYQKDGKMVLVSGQNVVRRFRNSMSDIAGYLIGTKKNDEGNLNRTIELDEDSSIDQEKSVVDKITSKSSKIILVFITI